MTHDLLHRLLHQYGDGFVFGLLLVESIGLPLPGETVMIAAAFYAASSHSLALLPLLGAAASGAVLGGMAGYAIGWRFGPPLLRRFGPRFGYSDDRRMLSQYLIDRNGPALIFFGRFFAVIRPFENLLAGATGMRWKRFALYNALGGIAWTSCYCIGFYAFGQALSHVAGRAALAVGVTATLALVAGVLLLRHHEPRLIAAARRAQAAGR